MLLLCLVINVDWDSIIRNATEQITIFGDPYFVYTGSAALQKKYSP